MFKISIYSVQFSGSCRTSIHNSGLNCVLFRAKEVYIFHSFGGFSVVIN